jgi:hypothetical protein
MAPGLNRKPVRGYGFGPGDFEKTADEEGLGKRAKGPD